MKKLAIHSAHPETVKRIYEEEKKSCKDIGDLYECSTSAVRAYMKRNGITLRTKSEAAQIVAGKEEYQDKRRLKLSGKQTWAKGKTWKHSVSSVEKRRKRSFGALNNSWKGGVSKDAEHLRQQRRNHKAIRRGKSPHMPEWANREKIAEIYRQSKSEGKTVDHIVPLSNRSVCGLHCEDNLRIVSCEENRAKGNKIIESICIPSAETHVSCGMLASDETRTNPECAGACHG